MKLIKEDGEVAGLYDICKWWINAYPPGLYVGLTPEIKEIANVRLIMQKILIRKKNREARDAKVRK